jgi:hypothetical protein
VAVLVAAGLGLVALSVVADAIGVGAGDYAFGWEQKLGVAVGMTVAWFSGLRLLDWHLLTARRAAPMAESRRIAAASA